MKLPNQLKKLSNWIEVFALFSALLVLALQLAFILHTNSSEDWSKDVLVAAGQLEEEDENIQKIYFRNKALTNKIDTRYSYRLYSEQIQVEEELPGFATIEGQKLIVEPTLDDLGEYHLRITAEDVDARYVYNYTLLVQLPEVDFQTLKTEVEGVLGSEQPKYAVYVYDLKRGAGFAINGDEIFYPGSTSKLPYAIITLRDVDSGKRSMASVSPILERLIPFSSNAAMMQLEGMLGGSAVYDQRVKDELGIDNYFRFPHVVQANDVGEIYKGLYFQQFLSKESNDYLLNLLLNVGPAYDNRIKQGIPDDIPVAHKTGWVSTANGEAYNDTALIFGEQTDFILIIFSKDINRYNAVKLMKPIAENVYGTLNATPI